MLVSNSIRKVAKDIIANYISAVDMGWIASWVRVGKSPEEILKEPKLHKYNSDLVKQAIDEIKRRIRYGETTARTFG